MDHPRQSDSKHGGSKETYDLAATTVDMPPMKPGLSALSIVVFFFFVQRISQKVDTLLGVSIKPVAIGGMDCVGSIIIYGGYCKRQGEGLLPRLLSGLVRHFMFTYL